MIKNILKLPCILRAIFYQFKTNLDPNDTHLIYKANKEFTRLLSDDNPYP